MSRKDYFNKSWEEVHWNNSSIVCQKRKTLNCELCELKFNNLVEGGSFESYWPHFFYNNTENYYRYKWSQINVGLLHLPFPLQSTAGSHYCIMAQDSLDLVIELTNLRLILKKCPKAFTGKVEQLIKMKWKWKKFLTYNNARSYHGLKFLPN